MEKRTIICILFIFNTPIHAQNIITLSQDTPYSFSVTSSHKKKPVIIHEQNKNYLKISCKPTDTLNNTYRHSCKIKAKPDAPEGTFALFLKTPENNLRRLFHVSIE